MPDVLLVVDSMVLSCCVFAFVVGMVSWCVHLWLCVCVCYSVFLPRCSTVVCFVLIAFQSLSNATILFISAFLC